MERNKCAYIYCVFLFLHCNISGDTIILFFSFFTELSSQFNQQELKPVTKKLPDKGFYYLTGPKNDKKIIITKTTKPLLVLETIHATIIVGIIDEDFILRAIYSGDKIVFLHEVGLDLQLALTLEMTKDQQKQYDLKFGEKLDKKKMLGGRKAKL